MKTYSFLFLSLLLLLAGCESISSTAPPITASLISAGHREHVDARTLAEGRSFFLNRCIQCHALPETAKYNSAKLREILSTMSVRASLTATEHEAVLDYLLTIRSL